MIPYKCWECECWEITKLWLKHTSAMKITLTKQHKDGPPKEISKMFNLEKPE